VVLLLRQFSAEPTILRLAVADPRPGQPARPATPLLQTRPTRPCTRESSSEVPAGPRVLRPSALRAELLRRPGQLVFARIDREACKRAVGIARR
jgi:hypothetical protein